MFFSRIVRPQPNIHGIENIRFARGPIKYIYIVYLNTIHVNLRPDKNPDRFRVGKSYCRGTTFFCYKKCTCAAYYSFNAAENINFFACLSLVYKLLWNHVEGDAMRLFFNFWKCADDTLSWLMVIEKTLLIKFYLKKYYIKLFYLLFWLLHII